MLDLSCGGLAIDHGRLFESERTLANRLRKLQEVTDVALTHLSSADLLVS